MFLLDGGTLFRRDEFLPLYLRKGRLEKASYRDHRGSLYQSES